MNIWTTEKTKLFNEENILIMENIINAAIQLVPLAEKEEAYSMVDKAIELIRNSGLKYKVCPFETVVEGEYESILQLISEIKNESIDSSDKDFIINLKLQFGNKNISTIDEKMVKYK